MPYKYNPFTDNFDYYEAGLSADIVDAKGDLLVGTAPDTLARLAVGIDGYVLVADSSATEGVAWKEPSRAFAFFIG